MKLELATCSYSAFDRKMGTPIRISRGAPRGVKLPSERFGTFTRWPAARTLIPNADYFRSTAGEVFASCYRRQLDDEGDVVADDLAGLAELHQTRLVLCCFEKQLLAETTCHRTLAGQWLADRLGIQVPELGNGLDGRW